MSEIEKCMTYFLTHTPEGRMVLNALAALCHRMVAESEPVEEPKQQPAPQQYPIMRL